MALTGKYPDYINGVYLVSKLSDGGQLNDT